MDFQCKAFADYCASDKGPEAIALDAKARTVAPEPTTERVVGSNRHRRAHLALAGLP
jgi:hypothetical protein